MKDEEIILKPQTLGAIVDVKLLIIGYIYWSNKDVAILFENTLLYNQKLCPLNTLEGVLYK